MGKGIQQTGEAACAEAQRQERAWRTWAVPRGAGGGGARQRPGGAGEPVARAQEDAGGWLSRRAWAAGESRDR